MEKEFYKLFLVVIMIISSFSLAFFIGRKIALSEQQAEQQEFEENSSQEGAVVSDHLETLSTDSVAETEEDRQQQPISSQEVEGETTSSTMTDSHQLEGMPNQKAEVQEYKKQLEDESNSEQSPDSSSMYGLLVDSFLAKEPAMEKATNLKLKFPDWPVFFKKAGSVYKVYLGPFDDIQTARVFLQEVKTSKQFPSVVLERVIKKNNSE